MSENLVSSDQGLIFFHFFVFNLGVVYFAPFLVFFFGAVLIWNFKSATEASAVFFLKHSLIKVRFVLYSSRFLRKSDRRNFLLWVKRPSPESLIRKSSHIECLRLWLLWRWVSKFVRIHLFKFLNF